MMDEADETAWTDDRGWGGVGGWRASGLDPDWLDATADDECSFWLGSHEPHWSWNGVACGPLFISCARLRRRKSAFPRARVPIAIDSGGFTEVTQHGGWRWGPREHVDLVRRAIAELGTVAWAAPQDWMCEDVALAATGKTIPEHQALTVRSYLDLVELAPDVRWVPVLQGWTVDDYLRCVDLYQRHGVDLLAHQLVGLGSVCRRQATAEIVPIVQALAGRGLRLHGFGVKTTGLPAIADLLRSADSLAWSRDGRWETSKGRRDSKGRNLGNSPEHAEAFRAKMLRLIRADGARLLVDADAKPTQLLLPLVG